MKGFTILTLTVATAVATPITPLRGAGVKARDVNVDEISEALYASWKEPKKARDVDVDAISQALYASWKEPKKARDVNVDEISEALYQSWKEPK